MEDKTPLNVLYKYRNWTDENHKKMLKENELFFASPRSFNDPFDCKIPVNFSILNTNEKIDLYVKALIAR
jgi:hypothetical protein